MRGRRGNKNRQRVEGGRSRVRVWSRGGKKLRHFSRMKVNGSEDLRDYANKKKPNRWERRGGTSKENDRIIKVNSKYTVDEGKS